MPIPLATLEGVGFRSVRRMARRAVPRAVPRAVNMAHAMYGLDEGDTMEPLGGWLTNAARKVSKVTRATVTTLRPIAGVGAEILRTVAKPVGAGVGAAIGTTAIGSSVSGIVSSAKSLIPSNVRDLANAGQSLAKIYEQTGQAGQIPSNYAPATSNASPLPSWVLPVGVGLAAVVAVLALKKR